MDGGVTWVSEPDISGNGMDEEVVYSVEVVAEIIVKYSCAFVRGRIEGPNPRSLLLAANTIIASGCAPVYESSVECASIGGVDRRIREVL